MNRILRVVGGPLKGAEIALVAGTKVKVGSGDGCDVLVSDPSLGDVAFELEVAEDEVSIITPDGATKTLLDYEAHQFGSSAFAIGVAEGAWPEVVWPEKSEERGGKSEERGGKSEEGRGDEAGKMPPKADPLKGKTKDARPETEDAKDETNGKKRRVSCLLSLILLAVVVVLALFAFWWLKCRKDCCAERFAAAVTRQVTLADVAEKYGVSVVETNGQVILRGNLKTRAVRLEATAAAFQAKPGVELDLMDDESLDEAADALVSMIVGEALKVEAATNRIVILRGDAGTSARLRELMLAMARDIPGLANVDCARVVCGLESDAPVTVSFVQSTTPTSNSVEVVRQTQPPVLAPSRGSRPAAAPLKLPLCGILTVPYPCIIQKNGNRVFEGGEFGGYTVEKITATAVTLRDGKRTFEWKP